MSETDSAILAADIVDERAEAFLEADNKQARLEGRFWSSLTCMADFAQRESEAAVLAERKRIADELFDFVRTDKRRVMSLTILRERLGAYITRLRGELK